MNKIPVFLIFMILLMPMTSAEAFNDPEKTQQRMVSKIANTSVSMAMLNDDVWVFELSSVEAKPTTPWQLSMMVAPKTTLQLPQTQGKNWSSESITVTQDQNSFVLTQPDGEIILTFSPYAPDGQLAGISFSGDYTHLYGLGADFRLTSDTFNLLKSTILPGGPFGNSRLHRFGYYPNQVQVPILYALGAGKKSVALFVDETLPLMWSLDGNPWTAAVAGPLGPDNSFRFFVITGPDMPSLRKKYMALTGRPPVPPRNILGVWATGVQGVTESQWQKKIEVLHEVVPGLAGLSITVTPHLEAVTRLLRATKLEIMLDESAYIPKNSTLYPELARRTYLVRQNKKHSPPLVVDRLGQPSALVDYTNSSAPTFWHSLVRAKQIKDGITSFRLVDSDLAYFSPSAWYKGSHDNLSHSHYAWANRFALKWLEGIEAGLKNQPLRSRPRLLLLSRSGTAGLPRFSGALYNGESFLFTMRPTLAIKAHMALSGLDYYSSDLSRTLHSQPIDQFGQKYEAWLAKRALTDYPLLLPEELLLTSTSQYNLALRENLLPYVYSLTWEAHLNGHPLVAPLVYYFQDDLKVRDRMDEVMLGPSLLLGLYLDGIAEQDKVYVPQGRWYNWRTGELIEQQQGGFMALDLKDSGHVTPPILARAGAIIPTLEEITPRVTTEKIFTIKIFIGDHPSEFTWYDDDGQTQDYLQGRFNKTVITAVTNLDGSTLVTIKAQEGSWDGAPTQKRLLIDIYGPKIQGEATLNGLPYNRVATVADFNALEVGWATFDNNRIRFKTPPLDLTKDNVLWVK